jgi:hypothetical protein
MTSELWQVEAAIREHAQSAGFPADSIAKVMAVIDPITAE